jgi:hypothetical protein
MRQEVLAFPVSLEKCYCQFEIDVTLSDLDMHAAADWPVPR